MLSSMFPAINLKSSEKRRPAKSSLWGNRSLIFTPGTSCATFSAGPKLFQVYRAVSAVKKVFSRKPEIITILKLWRIVCGFGSWRIIWMVHWVGCCCHRNNRQSNNFIVWCATRAKYKKKKTVIFTKGADNADCRLAFYRMFGSLTYAQFGRDGKSCETNVAPGAKNCGSQCGEIVC